MSGVTFSGDPGTTGREVFEDSTATGPGGKYAGHDNTTHTGSGNEAPGIGGGLHGQHGTGIATTGNDQHGHHLHGPGCGHDDYEGREGQRQGMGGRVEEAAGRAAGTDGRQHRHEGGLTGGAVQGGGYTPHEHHSHSGEGHKAGLVERATEGAKGPEGVTAGERHRHGEGHNVTDRNPAGGMLDRTGPGGPVTGGAAGTDRFDTGNTQTGQHVSGGQHETHTGLTGKNAFDSVDHSTERAEGKSSGGLMGILGTSDKDFTGRDRLPNASTSAYSDDAGLFKSNTHGPGGASALTGREGNQANNPVAQAKDDVSGVHGQGVTGTHAPGTNDEAGLRNTSGPAGQAVAGEGVHQGKEGEHKGFVQKIKDML